MFDIVHCIFHQTYKDGKKKIPMDADPRTDQACIDQGCGQNFPCGTIGAGTRNHLGAGPGSMFSPRGSTVLRNYVCFCILLWPTKDMAQHLLTLTPNAQS